MHPPKPLTMASLTYDSELMNQQVAAIAVPNSHNFVSTNDENGKLMIFSVGTDGVFYLCKEDHTGSRVMINLSSALRVAPSQVKAFDVVQNPSNSTLYIAIASMRPGTAQTDLLVLKPFKPTDVDLASPSLDLSGYIMPRTGAGQTSISAIYMSGSDKGGTYPETVFAYVPIEQVSKAADLARVIVNPNFDGWQLATNLHLPEDAFKIVDICPGRLQLGRGFFSLYLIQNQLQLMFTTSDQKYPASYKLGCPAGAKSLATFVDSSGYTPLLVGGSSLTYYTAKQCLQGSSGTVISSDKVFAGVQELYVTQTTQQLSIFAENAYQGIGYATTSVANPAQGLVASPLIPDGQGGSFSPVIANDSAALQFVVANSSGALSVLQQDPSSRIWSSTKLFIPNLNKNIDIQAYTVHVNLLQSDMSAMVNQAVLVSSTGWADIIVNGRGVSVGPSGVPVLSDEAGTLTLIIPTEDISSYVFTVGNVDGSNVFRQPITIDPSFKISAALSKISTKSDLLNAPLQSGGHLMDGTSVGPDEIEHAANAIHTLLSQRTVASAKVKAAATTGTLPAGQYRTKHVYDTTRSGSELRTMVAGSNMVQIKSAQSIKQMGWEAWHYITTTTSKIASWAVETATSGYNLIIQIGNDFFSWLVDGITEIGKAISWIFDKILSIAGKIIDWLGFIFNWKDIQNTHKSIVAIVKGGLDSGSANLTTLANKVDQFFLDLESTIKNRAYPDVLTQSVANPSTTENPTLDPQKSALNSTKGNYTQYQFTHGGASTSSTINGTQSSDPLHQAWTDVVQPAIASLQQTVTTVGKDIITLFSNNNKSLSVSEALQKLGVDVLLGIIDAIRAVIVGLIRLGADIIKDFRDYITKTINIPIFSALWKTYISGSELTFLDGLALLLAIPVTIISKLLTNKTPADMTGLNYDGLVKGTVTDPTQLLQTNGFMSLSSIIVNGLGGALQVFDDAASSVSMVKRIVIPQQQSHPLAVHNHLSKFTSPHPLSRAIKPQLLAANGYNVLTDWKLALGVIAKIIAIPTNTSLPGYPIRWISWLLSCAATLISAAIRSVTVEGVPPSTKEQALAATGGTIALVNFALICTINGMEFTDDYPSRDPTFTSFQVMSSIFDLVASEGSAAEKFVKDPIDKAIAELASYAGLALSGVVTGTTTLIKYEQGKYNYILEKI
ncbi:MAG: hypothetical protein Q9218_005112 [Villophora microphyllina]